MVTCSRGYGCQLAFVNISVKRGEEEEEEGGGEGLFCSGVLGERTGREGRGFG